MKLTEAEAKVQVIGDEKFLVIIRSSVSVPQELLNELHKDLHEWYYSPSKFFVLNLPDAIDLEFQKVDKND
jgi:hypothetical protein